MAYSIMLDAGHGGAKDPGAVYEGRQEKDDNLKLVLAIGERLSDRGLDVEYTRTTDVYETPYEKAVKANNAGVDLFISIHRNSFPVDNEVEGVESLVYDLSGLKYEIICQKFFYLTVIYNCATLCGFKIFFGSNTLLIPFINSRFSVGRDSLRYGFLAKPIPCSPDTWPLNSCAFW